MEPDPVNGLSDDQLADLARLADGVLPAERRAELEAQVAASPQLSTIVERQSIALDALRGTADTGAPARLHAQVERRRGPARAGGRRRIRVAIGGAITAAASVALALALTLPGAGSAGLSVADAAALAQNLPTQAAPHAVPATPQLLRARVDGVPFPNYAAEFGWTTSGARADDPSGRHATTVYYEKGGRTVAYTIVSGHPLDPPSHARSITRSGVQYRVFREGGRAIVTWDRGGRTCVLSSTAARPAELVTLADWRGKGAIPF